MTTDEQKQAIDNAWRIHAALVDWTGKVDSKASFTSALLSGTIIAILALTGGDRRLSHLDGAALVVFWIGMGLLILALVLVVYAVSPKIRQRDVRKEWPNHYIFFGHLKSWPVDALVTALTYRDILPMLAQQLNVMSRTAWRKHQLVRWALIIAGVGAALVGLAAATRGDLPVPSPAYGCATGSPLSSELPC
jgi:hypothetical protein